MAAQLNDFWTCGIFLSKEPYDELAIKCFMCDSLHYTIHDFQKHLAHSHADEDEEETIRKRVLSQNCQLNNEVYLEFSDVEHSDLDPEIINNNSCEEFEEIQFLNENDLAAKLGHPRTETIVDPVKQWNQYLNKKIPCNPIRQLKKCAAITKSVKTHKNKDGVMCEKCGLIFKERSRLWHHLRIAHYKLRPFTCSECPKSYARKSHLTEHMRSHSQRRDFVCSLCDKAFRRSQELTRHKLRHQTTKNYSCLRCDAKFRQHSGLYHHIKIKHSIKQC